METEKKVRYKIVRQMQYNTDYVKDYDQEDYFDDLNNARAYLGELVSLFKEKDKKPYWLNRDFRIEFDRIVNKYNQSSGDLYLGVTNEITREIIITKTQTLKGV